MNEQQLLALRSAVAIEGVKSTFHSLATDVTEPLRLEHHVRAHPLAAMTLAALTGFVGTRFLPRRLPSGTTQTPKGVIARAVARASRLARRTLESALLSSLNPSPQNDEAQDTAASDSGVPVDATESA